MTPGFQSVLVLVLSNPGIRDELLAIPDLPSLMARVEALAREQGIQLAEGELETVIRNNLSSWLQRSIDL
jgi:hypothetical protein